MKGQAQTVPLPIICQHEKKRVSHELGGGVKPSSCHSM